MTSDPLQRLRAANPVPNDVPAPPFEPIRAHVRTQSHHHSRWPRLGALVPTLAVAAALVVAALALLIVGGRAGHRTVSTHPSAPAARVPTPAPPHGGMAGVVELGGSAFPTLERGLISLEQCQPCHAAPGPSGKQVFHGWLATTGNGGYTWTVTRRSFLLDDPVFTGPLNGWSDGTQIQPGSGPIARYFVTHDSGRRWSLASSSLPSWSDGDLSVSGGEAWAVGDGCCGVGVMRGPVTGSRLSSTPAQPVRVTPRTVMSVTAAGARSAYVAAFAGHRATWYATHDGGASWSPISSGCGAADDDVDFQATSPTSLWAQCGEPVSVIHSVDGGRTWHARLLSVVLSRLVAVSAQVAWAITEHGAVIRSADGGASWQSVWSDAHLPRDLRGQVLTLSAQNAETAELVGLLTTGHVDNHARHTNLVVYRTTDAGQTWGVRVVRLPPG